MRSEQKQHQQHHHQLQHLGTLLPMLCSKPSMIKDVHIPNPFNKDLSRSGRRLAEDPSLSPKVGCMGQVKKKDQHHHNNYNYQLGMVFPTTTNNTTTSHTTKKRNKEVGHGSNNNFSYSKLLRLFSSKTLLAIPLPATSKKLATTTTTVSCRKEKIGSVSGVSNTRVRSRSCKDNESFVIGFGSPINVADLDPPLPVVIKRKTSSITSSASLSLVDGQEPSKLGEGDNNKINSSLWKRRSGGATLKGLEIQKVHIPNIHPTTTLLHMNKTSH